MFFILIRKELERRKQLDECNSLSNCSISSASASSSGSQSISFLEEIKMLGDHGKRNLRPVNSTDRTNNRLIAKTNDNIANNGKPEEKLKLVNPIKCDNSEKHKQHGMQKIHFVLTHLTHPIKQLVILKQLYTLTFYKFRNKQYF